MANMKSTLERPEVLTDQQWEVYQRVVRGITSRDIGTEMGITYKGVEFHCQRIKTRLGLSGPARNSIVSHAFQHTFL